MPKFERVVLLSDSIRGHYHQSLGVAEWLERLGGVHVEPFINVPKFDGLAKLRMKYTAGKLKTGSAKYAAKWLAASGFQVSSESFGRGTLFISAGSSPAPFCLALAKATGNKAAVIMTPSVLGTKPFDFAIIPEHDKHDPNDRNIITTLGAPNHIYTPELVKTAGMFFADRDFGQKVVAVLVGGSDANYKPSPEWARDTLGQLNYIDGVKVLLTTSRRTGKETDDAVEKIFAGSPKLGYMLLMSRNPRVNALTAMLGRATHVLVTEDSVSMVSEAVTAGFKVGLLRVPRITNSVKKFFGYGAQRFDDLFAKMASRGLITDLGNNPDIAKFVRPETQRHNQDFNEAKRAAEWILKHE